jgi:hypothetical protein
MSVATDDVNGIASITRRERSFGIIRERVPAVAPRFARWPGCQRRGVGDSMEEA